MWDYSSSTALAVAKCESGFNVSAIGDHGSAVGVFQFHPQTFKDFNCLFEDQEDGCVPRELLDRGNPEHNIKLGVWGLSHGKESHWTCHTKLFRRTTPH